jgi:hypothetical protein
MPKYPTMRKLTALGGFLLGAPMLLIFCISLLLNITALEKSGQVLGESTQGIAYAALPPTENIIENTIVEEDSKTEIIRQYMAKYNSPLEPYAPDIIAASNRYDLDYRLLTAIAMQESTLCKRIIKDSFNCWGWGIYGGKVTKFSNYPEAIETISKALATKYRDRGLITPFEIAKLYNPSNTNNWAENVSNFMNLMK